VKLDFSSAGFTVQELEMIKKRIELQKSGNAHSLSSNNQSERMNTSDTTNPRTMSPSTPLNGSIGKHRSSESPTSVIQVPTDPIFNTDSTLFASTEDAEIKKLKQKLRNKNHLIDIEHEIDGDLNAHVGHHEHILNES
jgi:hypothetical protein